eukprot:g3026.t1
MNIPHRVLYMATAVIALVDIVIFVQPYFAEDEAVYDKHLPLPKNDFARLVNFWKDEIPSGFVDQSKGVEGKRGKCVCDPLASKSKLVGCSIGPRGNMRTSMNPTAGHDLQFKCGRLSETRCQCCDCGTEEKTLVFSASDIKKKGICEACEQPNRTVDALDRKLGREEAAYFTGGAVYQMMFRLRLGLLYDYTALQLDIKVEGNFSNSWDNDMMIGFMDGAGTVWAGQRGDNGIWFSIGRYQLDPESNSTTPTFRPHSLGFESLGSRSSRYRIKFFQNNKGRGHTVISMDNNLHDNDGKYKSVATWRQAGWKSTGRAPDLQLVAFRDDESEIYAIHRVTVRYKKLRVATRGGKWSKPKDDETVPDEIRRLMGDET